MGACCSTDEDKGNINIDRKGGDNKTKSKVDKRGGKSPILIIFSIISHIIRFDCRIN